MTMSIRRMTIGNGVQYLLSSVCRGDETGLGVTALTRYYAETGTPPGRFIGAGLAGLDDGRGVVAGSPVSEAQLHLMLGELKDPVTGEHLGNKPRDFASGGSKAVSGFDLTFSVQKSVSVAWALADEPTQVSIYEAHEKALAYVLAYGEKNFLFSRSGKNGIVQEDIKGVVGTAYDHWDSRCGDPQMHTHVVVLNRVQTRDGKWRTLDSRGLFKANVGLSEMYNSVLSDILTADLGWGWEATSRRHSNVPKWEVGGVSVALQEEFSQRTAAIEAAIGTLVDEFAEAHGRQPTAPEVIRLRQQATIETRPEKQHRSLEEMVSGWCGRAEKFVGEDPHSWVESLANRNDLPVLSSGDLSNEMLLEVGKVAVLTVSGKRATFGENNLFAETQRQVAGVRFATPDERMAVVERATSMAVRESVLLSPPEITLTPQGLRREDATTRFRARGSEVYTTQAIIDAENRLLDASRATDGPSVSPLVAADVCAMTLPGRGHALSSDQVRAVDQVVCSGRVLDSLVGAAGTGKSTVMAGVRATWEREHGAGSVVGLAPSAAAAEVLALMVGTNTENTTKFLVEAQRNAGRVEELGGLRRQLRTASPSLRTKRMNERATKLASEIKRWSLRPGQLVIVDEASMVGTAEMDTLVSQAREAGAKVLLVGDWAQLSPVSAGGAFRLLTTDRDDVATLWDVRRFEAEWEKSASLQLRLGLPEAADTYVDHGRVQGGDKNEMVAAVYEAWQADTHAGKTSLMIAGGNDVVQELNHRARADRVLMGEVAPEGVQTDSGSTIGTGDLVVTRNNQREMGDTARWVKNGDLWNVTDVREDGSLDVRRVSGHGAAVLPAWYVKANVELGYATTAHRAQGRTVDTAHAFVAVTQPRETLYVMATRGKESNMLYVDVAHEVDPDTSHEAPEEVSPAEVLRQVLATSGADKSATLTMAEEFTEAHSVTRLWAEYEVIAREATEPRYIEVLNTSGLSAAQVDQVRESRAWGPLMESFRDAESRGMDVQVGFARLVGGRTLEGVDDVAAVLQARTNRWIKASDLPSDSVANLGPAVTGVTDPEMAQALAERRRLIEGHVPGRAARRNATPRRQPVLGVEAGMDRARGMQM